MYTDRERRKLALRDQIARSFRVVIRQERLKALTRAAGMTQVELAEATGLGTTAINRILNGRAVPTLKSLSLITDVLAPRLFERYGYTAQEVLNMLTQPKARNADEAAAHERTQQLRELLRERMAHGRRRQHA